MQVLEFTNIMFAQEKLINEYSMSDPRFNNSYNELTSTFAVRTFMNVMPMILEVLEKMKTEFYVEKNVCLSNGSLCI